MAMVMELDKSQPQEFDPSEDMELGREQILAVKDITIEKVSVPEWGGSVYVKSLSAGQRDELEIDSLKRQENGSSTLKNFRARFAAITTCDRAGSLLFSIEDVEALSKKSGAALDRILEAGKRLNRIGEREEAELVENFTETQEDDSDSN